MLRITQISSNGRGASVHLDGEVAGNWVAELRDTCENILAAGAHLTIDLSAVSFLDMQGASLIRELAARATTIENCSPFTAEQLKGEEE